MRITAARQGVYTEYGIAVPVGVIAAVGDEYGKSLVRAGMAYDTDGILKLSQNTPFDSGVGATLSKEQLFAMAVGPAAVSLDGRIIRVDGSVAVHSSSMVGSRLISGRSNAVAVSSAIFTGSPLVNGLTQHQRHVLPVHFDSVRIAIPNMHVTQVDGVKVAFGISNSIGSMSANPASNAATGTSSAAPTPTEVVSSSLNTFRQATFNGSSSASLPAAVDAANVYPSWTFSDWTQVASVDRVDGGAGSILDIRLFFPVAAASISCAYTGGTNDSWGMWARSDLLTGGRVMRVWNQDVDGIATPTNFTSTTTRANHVPVIVQYLSRSAVNTLLVIGDSISEASIGGLYTSNSPAWRAALLCSSPTEVCHMTMPGATSIQYTNRVQNVIASIKATHVVAPVASVNNFGTTLGTRTLSEAAGTIGALRSLAMSCGGKLAIHGFLPVTNAAKAYGATDSYRLQANAMAESRVNGSMDTWIDAVGVFSGVAHASGQIEPAAALTSDGIHPNDAGYNLIASKLLPFLA